MAVSEKMVDYLWQKQQVTVNNIANQSTPGYKAQVMSFDDELRKNFENQVGIGKKTSAQFKEDIKNSDIRLNVKEDEYYGLDGNTVNADVEQVELASTQLQYQAAIGDISAEFARLRVVIK